ncbi:MAG: endodeoxyribonuclease RusA [Patescibacteria group bacterium]|nr:endodeoxyribonuclease RusA [Patescibacteria group bacterium]
MNQVILPFPPSPLSPNSRLHWRRVATVKKAYRHACWALAKEAGLKVDWEGKIHVFMDFYPPDRRHRDDDNMVAAFKAGRDGIADALGVDDKRFVIHPLVREEIGGMVKIKLMQGP